MLDNDNRVPSEMFFAIRFAIVIYLVMSIQSLSNPRKRKKNSFTLYRGSVWAILVSHCLPDFSSFFLLFFFSIDIQHICSSDRKRT